MPGFFLLSTFESACFQIAFIFLLSHRVSYASMRFHLQARAREGVPGKSDMLDKLPLDGANWSLVPKSCRAALTRYLVHGIVPGSFLTAVLANQLHESLDAANETERRALSEIVRFLSVYAPRSCWGSGERIADWEFMGGLHGRSEAELAAMRDDCEEKFVS